MNIKKSFNYKPLQPDVSGTGNIVGNNNTIHPTPPQPTINPIEKHFAIRAITEQISRIPRVMEMIQDPKRGNRKETWNLSLGYVRTALKEHASKLSGSMQTTLAKFYDHLEAIPATTEAMRTEQPEVESRKNDLLTMLEEEKV